MNTSKIEKMGHINYVWCARKYAEAVLRLKDDILSELDQEIFVVGAEDTNSVFRTFVIQKLEVDLAVSFKASAHGRGMHHYHGLLLVVNPIVIEAPPTSNRVNSKTHKINKELST